MCYVSKPRVNAPNWCYSTRRYATCRFPCIREKRLSNKDIDFAAFHQPVKWAPNAWREAIGLAPEKFIETYELYGNIACAAAATNLLVALEQKLIKAGDNVLVASSGVGENHIALLQKVSVKLIESMNRYIDGRADERIPSQKRVAK